MDNYIKNKYNNIYYNIKSYPDIFIISFFYELKNKIEIYFLIKNNNYFFENNFFNKIKNNIFDFNGNYEIPFTGKIELYDLADRNSTMKLAGLTGYVTDRWNYKLICDTDPKYNTDEYPYIIGYNNWNYDSTMLALYLTSTMLIMPDNSSVFRAIGPEIMYQYHTEINSRYFKNNMPERLRYRYMTEDDNIKDYTFRIGSKYLIPERKSVAAEIRRYQIMTGRHVDVARLNEKQPNAPLYRQAGLLGYKIQDMADWEAEDTGEEYFHAIYMAVSESILIKNIFHDRNYVMTFSLKRQLILDYPELVYDKKPGNSIKDYAPDIDSDRIRYDRMTVNSTSAQIVSNCLCPYGSLKDIESVSFLYPSREKAKELGIEQVNVLDETYKFIKERMRPLVKDGQGKDILLKLKEMVDMYRSIEEKNFNEMTGKETEKLEDFTKSISVPYMDPDGRYSDCYVTFSAGGLHGAQYNKAKYDRELEQYEKEHNVKRPELFVEDEKGSTKLHKRFAYTSFGNTNHEDFISYYTILLCNMEAFKNDGLGYDRYEEIFRNKEKYGKLMKDSSLSKEERELYALMRENTKLILTSASGAADVNYNTSIRMNNRIISMRIIGQLFTWRIGQAQALAGASVVSTNTDGLYTIMDKKRNNEILKRESKDIHVGIEPESVFLVSKDANNRLEGTYNRDFNEISESITITSAHGKHLNGINGPVPTKAPDHPAIIDWGLAEILKRKALNGKMDDYPDEMGMKLICETAPLEFMEKRKYLQMFQHIIINSPDKFIYNFASKCPYSLNEGTDIEPIRITECSRVFYVNPKMVPEEHKDRIVYLAAAYVRLDKTDNEKLAVRVIKDLYNDENAIIAGTPRIKKITGIEYLTPCMIVNESLDSTDFCPEWLNYEYYNYILGRTYKNSWQNDVEEI